MRGFLSLCLPCYLRQCHHSGLVWEWHWHIKRSISLHPYLVSQVTGHRPSEIHSIIILSLVSLVHSQHGWPRLRNDFMLFFFSLSALAHQWEGHFQRESELSSALEMMIQGAAMCTQPLVMVQIDFGRALYEKWVRSNKVMMRDQWRRYLF